MKTTAELEARIAELEEAVNYALAIDDFVTVHWMKNELRSRAFQPKFEEVTEKRYFCNGCLTFWRENDNRKTCCGKAPDEWTRTYQSPIEQKTKHREEINIGVGGSREVLITIHHGQRIFREWEE